MSRWMRLEREVECRFAVETIEPHIEPETEKARERGCLYLTTEQVATFLQSDGPVRIVGVF